MKILIVTPRVYEPHNGKFVANKGGIELYLHDLVQALSKTAEIHVLSHDFGTPETIDGVHYVGHTKGSLLLGVGKESIGKAARAFSADGVSLPQRIKRALFEFDYGFMRKSIARLRPDVVHFHGVGRGMLGLLDFCRERGIPSLVTLHGLIGLDDSVRATQEARDIERALFQRTDTDGLRMTVISSGIKRRAVNGYGLADGSGIQVILNGIPPKACHTADRKSTCEKWGLDPNRRIVICVGSICENKGQERVLNAWEGLDEQQRAACQLVFAGSEHDGGRLRGRIEQTEMREDVRYLGFLQSDEVDGLYQIAALNILASVSEGFGLVLIEGMRCGVPALTYADLDAMPDLYDPEVMIALEDRSGGALSRGIEAALCRNWDYAHIRSCAGRYLLDNVASAYLAAYEGLREGNNA